jgi:hypothetical protein
MSVVLLAAFFDAVYTIYASLTPAKRALLTGFAYSLLPIAVDEAIKLQALHEAQRAISRAGGADKAGAVAILANRRREALSLRNNAIRAIRPHLAAEEQRARLNAFRGTAENAQKLADGLRGVAQTLEDLRAGAAPTVLSLLDEVGLGKPYAQKLVDTAELLLEADRATVGAPPQRMVSQRELDLQDGRVPHDRVVLPGVQSANDSDATILVPPLTRLTRLFKGHRAPKGSEPVPPVDGPVTD